MVWNVNQVCGRSRVETKDNIDTQKLLVWSNQEYFQISCHREKIDVMQVLACDLLGIPLQKMHVTSKLEEERREIGMQDRFADKCVVIVIDIMNGGQGTGIAIASFINILSFCG